MFAFFIEFIYITNKKWFADFQKIIEWKLKENARICSLYRNVGHLTNNQGEVHFTFSLNKEVNNRVFLCWIWTQITESLNKCCINATIFRRYIAKKMSNIIEFLILTIKLSLYISFSIFGRSWLPKIRAFDQNTLHSLG